MTTTTQRQIPIVCPGHTRPLADLHFCLEKTENKVLLVSSCHDKCPMLRDGKTGDWIGTWKGHNGAVWCAKLDFTANLVATASADYSVKIWDGVTGHCLTTLPHKHVVKTLDWSPSSSSSSASVSQYLVTGGMDGCVRVYDLVKCLKGVVVGQKHNKKLYTEPCVLVDVKDLIGGSKKVNVCKCLWLDHKVILIGLANGQILLWDFMSNEVKYTFDVEVEVRDMEMSNISRSGTTTQILTVAAGDHVTFFDLNSKDLLKSHKVPIHFREEGGASLHCSGLKFIAGGSDLWVRVFDFETGEELECHKGHHGPVRCLRYAPDGETYATGSEDGTIRIWQTTSTANSE